MLIYLHESLTKVEQQTNCVELDSFSFTNCLKLINPSFNHISILRRISQYQRISTRSSLQFNVS